MSKKRLDGVHNIYEKVQRRRRNIYGEVPIYLGCNFLVG
jgi:hypothetical protein